MHERALKYGESALGLYFGIFLTLAFSSTSVVYLQLYCFWFVVVAAVRAFGGKDQALNHILSQTDQNTSDGNTSSSAPIPNTIAADILHPEGGVEGLSGINEAPMTDGDVKAGPSTKPNERDVEMEDELTEELYKADALSDYDIEVTREGEAINEYLALLASAENGEKAVLAAQ